MTYPSFPSPPPAPEFGHRPARSALLGVLALLAALIAFVVAPILGGIAGYAVGLHLPLDGIEGMDESTVLRSLSPARTEVLWGEIGFWAGTLAGITGVVLGIVAIAQRRGRALGIVAVILAALGVVAYVLVLLVALGLGAGVATGVSAA